MEEGFLEEQLVDDASSLHTENNDASHGTKTLLEEAGHENGRLLEQDESHADVILFSCSSIQYCSMIQNN
jgi:hypothetical protein